MHAENFRAEYAIVGGGVSGLYSAWRLIRDGGVDPKSIAIFEGSDRIGGRLWSVTLKDEHEIPAELGGMFFSDAQDLVYRLCHDILKLEMQAVTPGDDFAWLRNSRFNMQEFGNSEVLPYHLAEDEQGLAPHQLLLLAVRRIAPDVMNVWPINQDSSLHDTVQYLRHSSIRGTTTAYLGILEPTCTGYQQ